jgi:hypothetical protein
MLDWLSPRDKGALFIGLYIGFFLLIMFISFYILHRNHKFKRKCKVKADATVIGFKEVKKYVGFLKETELVLYYPIFKVQGVKSYLWTQDESRIIKDMKLNEHYPIYYNQKRPEKLFYIEGSKKGVKSKQISLAIFLIILDLVSLLAVFVGYNALSDYVKYNIDDTNIESFFDMVSNF